MATSDPQFSGFSPSFSPSFEACPAQSIRRSSLKASSEYDVGRIRDTTTSSKDYEVPIGRPTSERKRSDNKQRSSSKRKSKKSKSSSSENQNNSSNNSSERRSSKISKTIAKMDGPMGQSGVTHLTDCTDKADNYTSRKKRAPAERATRPGVQHMTGDDVELRVKDPATTHRKNNRASRSAQEKIRDFNSGTSSSSTGPSPVSVVQDSKYMEEQQEYNDSSGLLGVDLVGNSGSQHEEEPYVPPVAPVQEEGYKSEKAKLFEGYHHNTNIPDPAQQENFMEQYTVVSRGSEDEELFGEDVNKRFNDSFNLSQEFALEKEDERGGQKMAAKGGAGAMPIDNPNQSQVVAARGMAGAPNYVNGTAAGGMAGFGYGDEFEDEGLAIAIAVDDSYYDSQDYYHHAIEFNPDAKPPLHKNRRVRFYSIMAAIFVCLAGGSVAAVLLLTGSDSNNDKSPSAAPSDAPTTATEGRYREQFISLVGSEVNVDGSAFDRAATWIMYEDRLRLSPIDDNLIQRYLLAYFYFETTQNEATAWKSCNRPKFNQESSCNHQKFMRNPADDSIFFEPEPATRWLSDTHECEWVGVQCDEGQLVIAVDVWGQELSGSLPAELALMPFLSSIALAYNDFTGTIPTEYAQMRHLVNLEIHGNRLNGSVPIEFWDALTLQNFNIAENDITGTLSTEVGQLTGLKGLHFSDNHISGSIPSELGNLIYLSYMRADGNQLTGSIPTIFGNLKLLQELWLQENLLSGTIPTQIGEMDELNVLRMDRNRIYGTIPEELFNNKAELTRLDLQDLLLSGTLSTSIGNLKNLESLRLRRNRLTGTIPTELAKIRTLRLAWLHLNEFSGSMPLQVCSRVGPGFLQYLNADCGPEGAPAQECACCSGCCDRQTELCQLTDFNP